jgi:hypothetical protein
MTRKRRQLAPTNQDHQRLRYTLYAKRVLENLSRGMSFYDAAMDANSNPDSNVLDHPDNSRRVASDTHDLLFNAPFGIPDTFSIDYIEWLSGIALGLDKDGPPQVKEVADMLGLNRVTISNIYGSEKFRAIHEKRISTMEARPDVDWIKQRIREDALPIAFQEHLDLLRNAPAAVKRQMVMDTYKLAGVQPDEHNKSDGAEAAAFLKAQNIQININSKEPAQLPIPQEYIDAMQALLPDKVEIVEASP